MATGTGKTVVMAMLIAWHTINKVHDPARRPVRQRSSSSPPASPSATGWASCTLSAMITTTTERDLVPADLWDALLQAQIEIVNYHAFLSRAPRRSRVSRPTPESCCEQAGAREADAFRETPERWSPHGSCARSAPARASLIVLNDEAHHCYQDKLLESRR